MNRRDGGENSQKPQNEKKKDRMNRINRIWKWKNKFGIQAQKPGLSQKAVSERVYPVNPVHPVQNVFFLVAACRAGFFAPY